MELFHAADKWEMAYLDRLSCKGLLRTGPAASEDDVESLLTDVRCTRPAPGFPRTHIFILVVRQDPNQAGSGSKTCSPVNTGDLRSNTSCIYI